jgi:hypothetical protein
MKVHDLGDLFWVMEKRDDSHCAFIPEALQGVSFIDSLYAGGQLRRPRGGLNHEGWRRHFLRKSFETKGLRR